MRFEGIYISSDRYGVHVCKIIIIYSSSVALYNYRATARSLAGQGTCGAMHCATLNSLCQSMLALPRVQPYTLCSQSTATSLPHCELGSCGTPLKGRRRGSSLVRWICCWCLLGSLYPVYRSAELEGLSTFTPSETRVRPDNPWRFLRSIFPC